ncbi:MAG: hypothetical protein ACRDTF_10805 [Pseudonocardiaceae bacterium]
MDDQVGLDAIEGPEAASCGFTATGWTSTERLVLRDELPAEARGIYDQAVLMLAQCYE